MGSQSGGRPSIDRAHTFPTPPASASSLIGITSQGNSYDWNQGMNSGAPHSQPLSIDTSLNNARSVPTTPATTPPGSNMHGMPPYQSQSGYDSKSYYSAAPPAHPHYASQPMAPYGQSMPTSSYRDMGPPSHRGSVGHAETEPDDKPDRYAQSNEPVGGPSEAEHETEYVHPDSGYSTTRGSYYTTNPSVGGLSTDHSQMSPDMSGSPHQNGSGRMTPRTSGTAPHWGPGYTSPPRPAASSSLYNLVSDTRGTSGPNGATDNYSVASNSAYSTGLNGSLGSNKRMREDDDDHVSRPASRNEYDGKRRKTLTEATVGGPVGGVSLGMPMKANGSLMAGRR